jgi:N-acetylglucosamine-6-phosphate deacetylase
VTSSRQVPSPTPYVIRGTVITPDSVFAGGWVAINGGVIIDVGSETPPPKAAELIDVGERIVAPGFVDVHVHGGGGGQAAGADPDEVAAGVLTMAAFHARHGTSCLLATTVSDTPDRLRTTVIGIRRAMNAADVGGAVIAGIHLEGPWISPQRAGAHDPEALRAPDSAELERLWEASGGVIRLLTLAPELPGADEMLRAARAREILVSVGHTDATYAQARAAFDAGARHLTHLGNGMPGLDRRSPGPIGAALADDRVTVEVIGDGEHVHPAVLGIVARAAPGRLVAITDAIAASGMPDGQYRLGRLEVSVADGRAVLAGRPETLAGSVLTMDRALATLTAAGVPLAAAVRAATATPSALIPVAPGEPPRGALVAGHRADLVILDERLEAAATLVGGRVVHDRDGLLREL